MLLKDLMEEKQLNLSQPLLSVRRYSSTKSSKRSKRYSYSSTRFPSPPSYRSDLKSGPVRTAGAVPFVWEKAPGKPKEHSYSKKDGIITLNPSTGKVSKVNQQQYFDAASPCGSNKVSDSVRISDKEEVKEKEKVAGSDDSDDEENFVDALDTLSRTESFFISTASVVEDQEVLQPSRSLASLPSNRDFIIDRFLPAAKALTSGPQPPSFRKKIVGQEQQQREVKKVVRPENSLPLTLSQHRPKALPHYVEDKTGDCDGAENFTATGCGLFPKLCLLSPITGSRNDDETTKEHAKTSFPWKKSLDSQPGFTEVKDILCVSEKSKHHSRGCSSKPSSSSEIPVVEKTLYVDSMHKVKSQTIHKGGDSSKHSKKLNSTEAVDLKNQQVGTKVGEDGKIDLESQRVMQLSQKETNDDDRSYMQLSLELPSLKAPSESWLKRTLPTISTSNLQSRTNNTCGRSQTHKTDSSMYPKWETIVKSSNVHHGHQRLPKELLASIPEA